MDSVKFTIYRSNLAPIPIIRNEELILLRAEANIGLNQLGPAVTDINFIRATSGNLPAYAGTVDQPSLLNELLYNKRYSLLYEGGHRWIDLRRYNLLNTMPKDLADSQDLQSDAVPAERLPGAGIRSRDWLHARGGLLGLLQQDGCATTLRHVLPGGSFACCNARGQSRRADLSERTARLTPATVGVPATAAGSQPSALAERAVDGPRQINAGRSPTGLIRATAVSTRWLPIRTRSASSSASAISTSEASRAA